MAYATTGPTLGVDRYVLNPGLIMLRGVLSIVLGLLAIAWPGPSLLAITLLWGAYAFVDGVMAIATGFKLGRRGSSWGLPVIEGVLGIGAGVVTVMWPGITLLVLSILVGAWAIATGVLELMAAPKVRSSRGGKIMLGVAGVFSVLLGAGIFMFPPLGAITLLMLVAGYSLVFGTLLVALGARLRQERKRIEETVLPRAA